MDAMPPDVRRRGRTCSPPVPVLLLNFDARSNTEYGLLRAYGEFSSSAAGQQVLPSIQATGAGSTGQASAAYMSRAFISSLASRSVTRRRSSTSTGRSAVRRFVGRRHGPVAQLVEPDRLTASFGSGFSATISVEDPQFRRLGSIPAAYSTAHTAGNGIVYTGNHMPDVVGNSASIRGWGSALVMAAYHEVRGSLAGGTFRSTSGFAVGGGIRLNLDMPARGDVAVVAGDLR